MDTAREEEWAKLKAEHESKAGCKLITVTIPETDFDEETRVLIKRPSPQLWRRIKAMHADETQSLDADEALVRECLVHPAFKDVCEERVGLVNTIAGQLAIAAGAVKGAQAKK